MTGCFLSLTLQPSNSLDPFTNIPIHPSPFILFHEIFSNPPSTATLFVTKEELFKTDEIYCPYTSVIFRIANASKAAGSFSSCLPAVQCLLSSVMNVWTRVTMRTVSWANDHWMSHESAINTVIIIIMTISHGWYFILLWAGHFQLLPGHDP